LAAGQEKQADYRCSQHVSGEERMLCWDHSPRPLMFSAHTLVCPLASVSFFAIVPRKANPVPDPKPGLDRVLAASSVG
jgi:hypothetical protein